MIINEILYELIASDARPKHCVFFFDTRYLYIPLELCLKQGLKPPGWLAWSDAPPPGMRTVAGLILRSGNILSWRSVIK